MLVLKSRLKQLIYNEREREKRVIEKDWQKRLQMNEDRIKGEYDQKILLKDQEIKRLENLIDEKNKYIKQADSKNIQAKTLTHKNRAVISSIYDKSKELHEQVSKYYVHMDSIKDELDHISKNLIEFK